MVWLRVSPGVAVRCRLELLSSEGLSELEDKLP